MFVTEQGRSSATQLAGKNRASRERAEGEQRAREERKSDDSDDSDDDEDDDDGWCRKSDADGSLAALETGAKPARFHLAQDYQQAQSLVLTTYYWTCSVRRIQCVLYLDTAAGDSRTISIVRSWRGMDLLIDLVLVLFNMGMSSFPIKTDNPA
ncbi:predicted protein [Histoplasma capsulatum G186AR]|uniref:Uncharacterized protein n=1 Tax=Ajellomyces capsulatus (strain G186AR / H82 / ATCC MYA-2454 / RMSCC 2432) TaxID=447093 RepID=C0NIP2_AJECG|nr:uncharacterized protein HCBG_02299 [Histoplasma capsulatum G186AR]EEH08763.1 predicted protein [Histoplasma capsulatum G186AR]